MTPTLLGVSGPAFRALVSALGAWLEPAGIVPRALTEQDLDPWPDGFSARDALYLRPESLDAALVHAAMEDDGSAAGAETAAAMLTLLGFDRLARAGQVIGLGAALRQPTEAARTLAAMLGAAAPLLAALPSVAGRFVTTIDTPGHLLAQTDRPLTAPPRLPPGVFAHAGAGGRAVPYLRSGWHSVEPWGVWSGRRPRLTLPASASASAPDSAARALLLRTHPIGEPARLRVRVNGVEAPSVYTGGAEPVLRVTLPATSGSRLDVAIYYPPAHGKPERGDRRVIGFGLLGLSLGTDDAALPADLAAWLERRRPRVLVLTGAAAAIAPACAGRFGSRHVMTASGTEAPGPDVPAVDTLILDLPEPDLVRLAVRAWAERLADTGAVVIRLGGAVTPFALGSVMAAELQEEDFLVRRTGDLLVLTPGSAIGAPRPRD